MNWIVKFRLILLRSVLLQSVIDILLTVLVGIFSGTFVTEITENNKIVWTRWPETTSFYALLILGVLLLAYKKMILGFNDNVHLFMDKEYCLAYAKSQLLPEAALKAKEKIRDGTGGEFLDAMKEIEKVLK